jgi:hypothetical protein
MNRSSIKRATCRSIKTYNGSRLKSAAGMTLIVARFFSCIFVIFVVGKNPRFKNYFNNNECFLFRDSPSAVTRIAFKPLTGHSCSQMPHPIQRSGSI